MICRNCGGPITGGKGDYFHTSPGNPTYCPGAVLGTPDPHAQFTAYPNPADDEEKPVVTTRRKKDSAVKIARYTVVFELALGTEDGVEEHHGVGDKAVSRVASKLAGYIADRDPLCTFEIVRREIVDVEGDEGGFTPAQGIERSFENDTDGLLADIASLIRPAQEEA